MGIVQVLLWELSKFPIQNSVKMPNHIDPAGAGLAENAYCVHVAAILESMNVRPFRDLCGIHFRSMHKLLYERPERVSERGIRLEEPQRIDDVSYKEAKGEQDAYVLIAVHMRSHTG
jgi:hypothetical protein